MLDTLELLVTGGALTQEQARAVFESIFRGEVNETQIGAMLALIQRRGATVDELVGGALAMRTHVTPVPYAPGPGEVVIDTCGTGGAAKTMNVSTAAAIVAAAAGFERGLRVAKHGGKSRTGRGSADVLAKLGVNVDASPEAQAECLRTCGVCFSFAIHHHPAMKHAAGPRRSLGFPTIFNLLGPLTNPAGAQRQVIGVYHPDVVEKVAQTALRLGTEHVMVVHGVDGLDEISTTCETIVANVRNGVASVSRISPEDAGLPRAALAEIRRRDLDDAANTLGQVLAGAEGPTLDIVLLNAAAALVVGGIAPDLKPGVAMAREAVGAGRAAETLERLVKVSNG